MKHRLNPPPGPPGPAPFASIYENLDEQQLAAVRAPLGPLLIVAGAGTGKTRTLMARCAHLIASGANPGRILLCTFTLKAAREMRSRIHRLVGATADLIWAGTFHHVGHRLLRMHASSLGLAPDFSILDASDALELLGVVMSELHVPAPLTAPKCERLFSLASGARQSIGQTVRELFPDFAGREELLERVLDAYRRRKAAQHAVDFDDMLELWMRLLEDPACGEKLRGMFDHVLVDEYQDTNPLQADIVQEMARKHCCVTVVGDDAQSIYSFRGARLDTLQQFLQRFPDARVQKLEQNYRCAGPILDLANASLAFSGRVIPKTLVPHRPGAQLPVYVRCADTAQEAQFIAQHLWLLHTENAVPLHEMAVLTRTNAQSVEIQLEFSRRGIPFRVQGGMRLLEQAHFKDFLAYLHILLNPADEMAMIRVFRLMPGLGLSTARQVLDVIHRLPLDPAAPHPLTQTDLWSHLPRNRREALSAFGQWVGQLGTVRSRLPELLERILENYIPILKSKWDDSSDRIEELQQIVAIGNQYGTADEMLADLGLQSGPVAEMLQESAEPEDLAVISTVHQAKGLEWRVVFIPSLCEGSFPLLFSGKDADAQEEERRIFHVAVTRARDELYLTLPLMSASSDRSRVFRRPSRFIMELPPSLYEIWEIERVS